MSFSSGATRAKIEKILTEQLPAEYIEIEDESWKHAGHAAAGGGGHFRMTVVSERFKDIPLLNRNRLVFDLLAGLMHNEIHALSIRAKTPEEWKS